MTTSDNSTAGRWAYTGTGALKTFAYDNKIFVDSDLEVYVDGALKTLTTDYTISGAGEDGENVGGNVTFVTAPADGAEVVIIRKVGRKQESEYVDGDTFPADVVEDDFDRAMILIQDLWNFTLRTLRLSDTDAETTIDAIPAKATRLGKALTFNAVTGAPEATTFADLPVDAALSDADPADLAAAAAPGISDAVARGDHVHALPSADQIDPDILRADTDGTLAAGYAGTAVDDGTKTTGTYSPTHVGGNVRLAVNGGAHTLAPPSGTVNLIVQYTNNASAGTITTSGFDKVVGVPDTTNTNKWRAYIEVIDGVSLLTWVPMQ